MTNSSFLENGVHFKLLSRLKPAGIRSGLFFDRDGVIVTDPVGDMEIRMNKDELPKSYRYGGKRDR